MTRLGIAAEQTVIDFGAGTGNFAIQAALTGASVHAADISQYRSAREHQLQIEWLPLTSPLARKVRSTAVQSWMQVRESFCQPHRLSRTAAQTPD